MPFKKHGVGLGGGVGVGAGVGVGRAICADAGFLANARKGKLAAPTAVTLSSRRRVRTCFMRRSPG